MKNIITQFEEAIKFEKKGEFDKAIEIFSQIAQDNAKDVSSRQQLAINYFNKGGFKEAEKYAREGLRLNTKNIELNYLLAEALWHSSKRDLAIRHLNFTLQLVPKAPKIHATLAKRYFETAQLDLAIKHFLIVKEIEPKNIANLKELARTFFYTQQLDKAVQTYKELLQIEPDNAELHFMLGTILLSQYDTLEGWEHYAWRHKYTPPQFTRFKDNYQQWVGQDLKDKSILVTWEQGLGDTIHFARYVKHLIQMGAHVILDIRPILIELMGSLVMDDAEKLTLHNADTLKPDADYIISVMDIPYILRNIGLEDIKYDFPYLKTPTDLKDQFQKRLDHIKGLKIGISWQGNPDYPRDAARSIPLDAFKPLAEIDGISLISLQAIFGTDQIKSFIHPIEDLESDLLANNRGLSPLAAAIESVDLVICCDSVTAHLAGALNIPAWLLIPTIPDWRWGWKTTHSHLYPSIKLVRCPSGKNWYDVLKNIVPEIQVLVQKRGG